MRRRSPARWLAPLALVTAAVAVYAVVHETLDSGSGDQPSTTSSTPARPKPSTAATKTTSSKPRTYTVKSGDVLSSIADEHGTTVAAIVRLNPSVDASTLHPGQKLKLP